MIGKLNWPAWLALLLSIFALFSYPFLFVNWAATRDFPWLNLAMFAGAAAFLFIGIRRAFAPGKRVLAKVSASILAVFSVLALTMFILMFFVGGRALPLSTGAPQVGQKAPDFALVDTNNKPVTLVELFSQPINGRPAKGVLLIFYRGYW